MSNSFLSRRLARTQGPPNDFARAVAQVRGTSGVRWDLTISNPTIVDLPRDWEPVHRALSVAASERYTPTALGSAAARERIASHLRSPDADEHGFFDVGKNHAFDAARLMLTASTSDSYSYLFKALCEPGDVVLVPEPSYPLLELLATLEGVRMAAYRLNYDGAWHVDWDSVESAMSARAKAIVVVTPNNPTASCSTVADFRRFGAYGVPLIVDQVFAPFARRGTGAQELPYHEAETLTFVLDGASKRCALPQLKLGWIGVFGARRNVEPTLSALESIGDTYLAVNSLSEAAIGDVLESTAQTRCSLRARLATNLSRLNSLVESGAPVSVFHYQGGWTAMVRLPNYRTDDEWARALLERRVIVQPGWLYDCPGEATLILSLITPETIFDAGLSRLREVVTTR